MKSPFSWDILIVSAVSDMLWLPLLLLLLLLPLVAVFAVIVVVVVVVFVVVVVVVCSIVLRLSCLRSSIS